MKTYNIAIQAAVEAGKKILEIYDREDFQVTEKDDKSPLTIADREAHKIIVSFLEKTDFRILSEEGKSIPYEERRSWETFWLVDPLDGTKEFIKRNGEFTVNIALIKDQRPVFGVVFAPVLNELFVGIERKGAWKKKNPGDTVSMESLLKNCEKIPQFTDGSTYKVVASRSHLNEETSEYLKKLEKVHGDIEIVSKGSSLKLCMVASGEANEYPRLGPTMEWDTAAAHAVVLGAGKSVKIFGTDDDLQYNKENLLNPYFLVK